MTRQEITRLLKIAGGALAGAVLGILAVWIIFSAISSLGCASPRAAVTADRTLHLNCRWPEAAP